MTDLFSQVASDFARAEQKTTVGCLTIKPISSFIAEAASRPDPKNLWNKCWYEGEVCCLFADSNVGKSILAVQIAEEIAKEDKVLYFDFELSDKQLQLRYSNEQGSLHTFPPNLFRAEINPHTINGALFVPIPTEIGVFSVCRTARSLSLCGLHHQLCAGQNQCRCP
jgi:hypothetical protein